MSQSTLWAITFLWVVAIYQFWSHVLSSGPCTWDNEGSWAVGMAHSTSASFGLTFSAAPAVTCASVTDDAATFVADPFLLRPTQSPAWYLFYEVKPKSTMLGVIAVSRSDDQGASWVYGGIVLRSQYHLSYPLVTEHEGAFYMLPECSASRKLTLYTSTGADFPMKWTAIKDLLPSGPKYIDSSLVLHNNIWWLFSTVQASGDVLQKRELTLHASSDAPDLRLWSSPSLLGPYSEHPLSPLDVPVTHRRPGGRPVVYQGALLRFAQFNLVAYGESLLIINVSDLTLTTYAETEVAKLLPRDLTATSSGNVPLAASLSSSPASSSSLIGPLSAAVTWASRRVHHVDAQWLADPSLPSGGKWIAAVDGDLQLTGDRNRACVLALLALLALTLSLFLSHPRFVECVRASHVCAAVLRRVPSAPASRARAKSSLWRIAAVLLASWVVVCLGKRLFALHVRWPGPRFDPEWDLLSGIAGICGLLCARFALALRQPAAALLPP